MRREIWVVDFGDGPHVFDTRAEAKEWLSSYDEATQQSAKIWNMLD